MDQSDPKGAFGDTLARYYHQSESETAVTSCVRVPLRSGRRISRDDFAAPRLMLGCDVSGGRKLAGRSLRVR